LRLAGRQANGRNGIMPYYPAMLRTHRVAALVPPGHSLFELSIVAEVFGLDRPDLDADWWYEFEVFSARPGRQRGIGGLAIDIGRGVEAVDDADTVVIPA